MKQAAADQASASSPLKTHLYGLDLLRFFAALLVVFNHFGAFSSARADVGEPFAFPRLNFMTAIGWVGVEIFFVISGFVIALSARGSSAGGFLLRRALRIFPVLWICSCLAAAALATTGQSLEDLVPRLLHSVTLFPRGPYLDGVIWSLIIEAAFYLLIWLTLLTNCFKHLDRVAAILGIISTVFLAIDGLAQFARDVGAAAHLVAVFEGFAFKVLLLRYGVFFALGMILWLGFEYGFTARRIGLGCLFGLFGGVEIAIQAGSDATRTVFAASMSPIPAMALPIAVWSAAIAALVVSVACRSNIGRLLRHRARLISYLGLITFPLYLNHYTIGRLMVYEMFSMHMAPLAVLLISLTTVFCSSWLIMRFIEPAIRRGLRNLLQLDRQPPMSSSQAASI